ncbi:MAG: hypothetical protein ACLP2H_13920 [Terriglobales bacterium]
MRRLPILLIAAVVLTAPVFRAVPPVSATERSANLRGVPLSQEKHHHLVLENPYVKVYEVEVGPREATLMHQHLRDYAYIVLGDCDLTNAVAGKPIASLKLPDTTVDFSHGMFSHIATNNGDAPCRKMTIELLRPQGEVNKVFSSINQALASGDPDSAGMVGVLESEEMRLTATAVAPGSSWSPTRDERDRLVLMIDKIHNTSGPKEHNSPFPAGMLAWVPAGKSWKVDNPSAQPMKLMVLEFKDSAQRSSLANR